MTNTPEVDAMILPVPGRDVVTGQPIEVVHADDARVLERQRDKARTQITAMLIVQKGKEKAEGAEMSAPNNEYTEIAKWLRDTAVRWYDVKAYRQAEMALEAADALDVEISERDALRTENARLESMWASYDRVARENEAKIHAVCAENKRLHDERELDLDVKRLRAQIAGLKDALEHLLSEGSPEGDARAKDHACAVLAKVST